MEPNGPPLWRVVTRILCLVTGAGTLACCALYLLLAWATGPDWTPVNGMVVSSGIDASEHTQYQSGRRGGSYRYTLYSVSIDYRYQVGGRDYDGHGIGDGIDRNYTSRSEAVAVLTYYTRGALVVYYDRANPARSALDTGIVSRIVLFVGAIGLALFLVGFVLRRMDAVDEEEAAETAYEP
jgi:hypothetical protein